MFDRFTIGARRVIFLARLEAGRLKFHDIDTRHLLLAFIDNDQRSGAFAEQTVYMAADEDIDDDGQLRHHNRIADPFLKSEIAASLRPLLLTIGDRDEPQPNHVDMTISERARRVISDAIDFAGDHRITPLHLFWAMLGEEQGEVADLLSKYGFDRELVAEEIRARSRP
jgi:ATP-dependent Clp protease ATP-binding subunit ClpA